MALLPTKPEKPTAQKHLDSRDRYNCGRKHRFRLAYRDIEGSRGLQPTNPDTLTFPSRVSDDWKA